MRIAHALLDEIVAHAVRDAPNECCGVVVGRDGTANEARALENLAASPFRFDIDGREVMTFAFADEDEDQLLAIYHSHTRSEPVPSQTDMNFAAMWPGVQWLIVGISKHAEPVVRNWSIEGGVIAEADLEVT
ncbi:MAG: [CysO sulfur-carrier protein]-S-L-cysteine hydrolase [Solirubrobacteraceae bacterium]|nr:[CysO sulfur-carrier protein]-S-L-cysteine hydrolase [Solirubrobacteraceae bacterium]